MARLYFTSRLKGVAPPDGLAFPGLTVGQALSAACAVAPLLRSYLFNEFGQIRPELAVAVDTRSLAADRALREPLPAASDLFILDAGRSVASRPAD